MPGRRYPGFHDSDAVGCRYHERDCATGEMLLMRTLIAASPQQTRAGLPQDWQQQYDITPVPMRTFVEISRFPGITYKASGWFHVGTTQGRGRYDTKMEFGKPKKDIWLCPLGKDWKSPPFGDHQRAVRVLSTSPSRHNRALTR